MVSLTPRRISWPACFTLVFVSAFFLSGTLPPPLELDPSWHAALEYATARHLQFGTRIVFTFGPLGFLSARTSLGHLVGLRIAFAFFWSLMVALAATALAKRLPGWGRYAFLAWLVAFTLSEGLDQTAFFVMACGACLLLIDDPQERWQSPLFVFAWIILSLIKMSFLTAVIGSVALIMVCWIGQRKTSRAIVLALAAPSGFIACWVALGQSPSHLIPWFRNGLELESGYSGAMNLVPKTSVLLAALAALALFVGVFIATIARAQSGIRTWGVLITLAQYVFFAWKEGFTRSGNWHTFVFLWFLPLGVAFCFPGVLTKERSASSRWIWNAAFAACMALCIGAANLQTPGFAWRQITGCPFRVARNARMIFAVVRGRSDDLYAGSRHATNAPMLALDRAKTVIGGESVDVMNYLALAAVVNGLNYRPRPVFQGFVAYTPALQNLNAEYFQSEERPRFVMLRHQATDGRFPTLEDSAALNYVLNNYVPVARDGNFLILQQRTTENPVLQLAHQESVRFGEKLDLRPWGRGPLFMSVGMTPSLLGRAVTLVYQQHPLYMRVSRGQEEERYRIVATMAAQPFLVNPIINSNYDVMNLYVSNPGKEAESVTFERPTHGAFEFLDQLTVRLYTAQFFPRAAKDVPAPRILADVEGRVFWPPPVSTAGAAPARFMIFQGNPALMVRAPSKVVLEIPQNASSFSGYFGIPEEAYSGGAGVQGVEVSIAVEDRSGKTEGRFQRLLRPSSRPGDRGRFFFRIPLDSVHDRSITLATRPGSFGGVDDDWSVWSQCRFEELPRRED